MKMLRHCQVLCLMMLHLCLVMKVQVDIHDVAVLEVPEAEMVV